MFYPKNEEKELSNELFKSPTCEYRGTPFWAWNCKLNKNLLLEEIDQLKEMGMGGFHVHCRTGMATEYLSDEFMDLVKMSDEKAKENDMLCYLYDEDRWPSGFGGGLVTKDKKYRARFLVFTPSEYSEEDILNNDCTSSAKAVRSGKGKLLGKYEVILKDGYIDYYKKLNSNEKVHEGAKVWWAYLETSGDNPWFNNESYVNTLDKEAIKKFVEITHEKYYEVLGDEFGKSIPSIFTDEPQFSHKECLGFADEEKDITLPFTDDFDDTYKEVYGESILDFLPELIWELKGGKVSLARYHYHDHISERFSSAYADTIGEWCKSHGIMLTGHMMEEPTLLSQTSALGEAMRSYRSFGLPGIDMLCDSRELSTAKQAQSASHQYGCPGVLSEIYGVTNWDFDFRGHKLSGDWQAALGVTVRVHHLTWVSMEGEAKRDYPASIGYQSPWYKEYSYIENHFARLNAALTRGKSHVRVGVIHPIESYWLHFGPKEQTSGIREEMENNFNNIINWLLYGLVDFDFICESLLPSQSGIEEVNEFKVGEMKYDVIIVPSCETLRSTTLNRLKAFRKAGGRVIFAGEAPKYIDAKESDEGKNFSKECINTPFTRSKVLESVKDFRDIEIKNENGEPTNNLIYQMREDNEQKWLFISHVNKMKNPNIPNEENVKIKIKGIYNPKIYDTMTGDILNCPACIEGNYTIISYKFYEHDSLLLCLNQGEPLKNSLPKCENEFNELLLSKPLSITLSEPNVMLLDMAEYSFDGGVFSEREELLRIDNEFRKKLHYPLRMEALAQPWVNLKEEIFEHTLSLKFKIESEIEVKQPYIALENAEMTEIVFNGNKIASEIEGWYVDKSIKKVKLPLLPKGISEIILNVPFNSKTNIEWCYLLGDFGVKVNGSYSKIIEPVTNLSFGDYTTQGLPFYAGNVTYHCPIQGIKGEIVLQASHFRNPLLSISLDGKEKGKIALSPYKINLGFIDEGKHTIDITAFGNRVNAFGSVHNCDSNETWFGPNAWRTTGNRWSYEYQLKPEGVLVNPRLFIKK